ncbi:hypothetical protein QBC37DRAFT_431818 [Rhypophila decipiens]|uniref:Uncharacterized protein n=1 Tax=Rhypophila decipiens TaxID=261697 RepID=A0AAN6XXL3_9PEZI|nr:hypothetical protein QBC37DRAFT_431818 [Rhypophila decipiens]
MNPQTACRLAKLAAEIRLQIYAIYLDLELQSSRVMTYSTTYLTDLSTPRIYRASAPPPLAQTCKFFYIDLEPLFRHVFAIHVMPARWGLRVGMGGYGSPSPAESDGCRWDPAKPTDGGGLVLTQMKKCYLRLSDPEMEGLDALSDFFAQVTSNAERERCKEQLWDFEGHERGRARGIRRLPAGLGLRVVPIQGGGVTTIGWPVGQGSATAATGGTLGILRGMGTYAPEMGPSRRNGLGKAAEGVRELVFDYAPIRGVGCKKVVSEAMAEVKAEQRRKIEKRFWRLVRGMRNLQVLRIRGDECPGWWKGYLEEKMARRIKAGRIRIIVNA